MMKRLLTLFLVSNISYGAYPLSEKEMKEIAKKKIAEFDTLKNKGIAHPEYYGTMKGPNMVVNEKKDNSIILTYDGLTILRNNEVKVDTDRWNLSSKGPRSIYTPNDFNRGTKVSIEIVKDAEGKIIGVKEDYSHYKKSDRQVYYLDDAIVEIENGHSEAYTKEGCENLEKMFNQAVACASFVDKSSYDYIISQQNLNYFPEFPSENIVYGKPSKKSDTGTYTAGSKFHRLILKCQELNNYLGERDSLQPIYLPSQPQQRAISK